MRRSTMFLLVLIALCAAFGLCRRASASSSYPPSSPPRPVAKPDTSIVLFPFDKAPELIQTVTPVYPEEARKSHVQAVVMLSIVVDKRGTPRSVKAVEPPKLEGRGVGHMSKAKRARFSDLFAKSAVEAANKWRFEPAQMEGKPVAAKVRVPVGYKIEMASFEAGVGATAGGPASPKDPSFDTLPSKRRP